MAAVGSPQTRGFLFADLRDYTRFAEQHGDAAAADLLRRYRALVRDVIARHEGGEIRTEGDSFYVVFGSVSVAVQAALAILDAAAAASAEGVPIRPGIGVNAGETADTDEGIVSTAVNVAARVCAIAGPGELLVTDTVRALTRTYLDVRFIPRGARRLKNIAEPVELFRVVARTDSEAPMPTGWRAALARSPGAGRPHGGLLVLGAIAVLTFSTVAAFAWLGPRNGGAPDSSPTRTAAGTGGAGSPGADGSGAQDALSSLERDLVARLPADVAGHCRHASLSDGALPNAVGSVVCHLPAGESADTVWYDLMDTSDAAILALTALPSADGLPSGDCSASVSRANGTWTVGVLSGVLACYQDEGENDSWIVWTYEDPPLLARALRSDLDWADLFGWWRTVGPYLSVDPEGRR